MWGCPFSCGNCLKPKLREKPGPASPRWASPGARRACRASSRERAGDPALLLADEPTGNLDPQNARQVLALLKAQVKERGAAAILATHSVNAPAGAGPRHRPPRKPPT